MSISADDIVHWVDHWCWTYDPRLPGAKTVPFDLFPMQADFLRWIQARVAANEDGLAEKSRDVGATFLCAAYAVHAFLFTPGAAIGFGSRKLCGWCANPSLIITEIRPPNC